MAPRHCILSIWKARNNPQSHTFSILGCMHIWWAQLSFEIHSAHTSTFTKNDLLPYFECKCAVIENVSCEARPKPFPFAQYTVYALCRRKLEWSRAKWKRMCVCVCATNVRLVGSCAQDVIGIRKKRDDDAVRRSVVTWLRRLWPTCPWDDNWGAAHKVCDIDILLAISIAWIHKSAANGMCNCDGLKYCHIKNNQHFYWRMPQDL